MEEIIIDFKKLLQVLNKKLGVNIIDAEYQAKKLHGGTLGNVNLISGIAETDQNGKLHYKIVLKTQKQWERYDDPNSWRREYDFYTSDLGKIFTDSFRWPECYHADIIGDEIQLWIEYIDGVSGLNLTGEMYELVAKEIERFQGKLYVKKPDILQNLTNLSKVEYMKNFYLHYRSWNVVYDYIRAEDCEIPKHLRKMLIDIDNNADEILKHIEKLPIVLCHRDFWVTNIFNSEHKIVLIDWDTTGWGFMGEDIASLIADEANADHMVEYYHKCISAYYKGFSEFVDISHISYHYIYEMILLMYGYRLVEWYINSESNEEKILQLNTLQKIYEMNKNCNEK